VEVRIEIPLPAFTAPNLPEGYCLNADVPSANYMCFLLGVRKILQRARLAREQFPPAPG
jgi:hypothetical protein